MADRQRLPATRATAAPAGRRSPRSTSRSRRARGRRHGCAVRTTGRSAALRRRPAPRVARARPRRQTSRRWRRRVTQRSPRERFNAALFGAFGALALVLAALGVYAVTSFAVAQRTREIGLRMALGADRARVLWAVVREGMTTVPAAPPSGCSARRRHRCVGLVHGVRAGGPDAALAGGAAPAARRGARRLRRPRPARRPRRPPRRPARGLTALRVEVPACPALQSPRIPVKNPAPRLDDAPYERNFADINPRLTESAAQAEASRCLFCYDAPCIRACPTAIDIPSFIRKIGTGNLRGSARTILEANVLGHSCARVCPVEVLCEGACVLNQEHKRPVAIGALQRVATDHVMDRGHPGADGGRAQRQAGGAGRRRPREPRLRGRAGAHGLRLPDLRQARRARRAQHARHRRVQDARLRRAARGRARPLARRRVRGGVEVGRDVTIAALWDEADAVFLGVGLGVTEALGLPGEDLPGVWTRSRSSTASRTGRSAT